MYRRRANDTYNTNVITFVTTIITRSVAAFILLLLCIRTILKIVRNTRKIKIVRRWRVKSDYTERTGPRKQKTWLEMSEGVLCPGVGQLDKLDCYYRLRNVSIGINWKLYILSSFSSRTWPLPQKMNKAKNKIQKNSHAIPIKRRSHSQNTNFIRQWVTFRKRDSVQNKNITYKLTESS